MEPIPSLGDRKRETTRQTQTLPDSNALFWSEFYKVFRLSPSIDPKKPNFFILNFDSKQKRVRFDQLKNAFKIIVFCDKSLNYIAVSRKLKNFSKYRNDCSRNQGSIRTSNRARQSPNF